jgi:hypothetical protein
MTSIAEGASGAIAPLPKMPLPKMTVAEYLDWEPRQEQRYEYASSQKYSSSYSKSEKFYLQSNRI